MRLRNNTFAAAFDYLKRNTDIKTQKELARRMGVTENTITRILKDYTEVTEDIITKLQTATGCIFNLQWLRGEDSVHMLAEDVHEVICPQPPAIQQPSLVNSLYEQIIKEKDARISLLETMLKTYQQRISELENQSDCLPTGLKIG